MLSDEHAAKCRCALHGPPAPAARTRLPCAAPPNSRRPHFLECITEWVASSWPTAWMRCATSQLPWSFPCLDANLQRRSMQGSPGGCGHAGTGGHGRAGALAHVPVELATMQTSGCEAGQGVAALGQKLYNRVLHCWTPPLSKGSWCQDLPCHGDAAVEAGEGGNKAG